MAFEGMNPDEQDTHASRMSQTTAAAQQACNTVMGNFDNVQKGGEWVAPFLDDMMNIFMPQVRYISEAMEHASTTLHQRAQMQRDASNS